MRGEGTWALVSRWIAEWRDSPRCTTPFQHGDTGMRVRRKTSPSRRTATSAWLCTLLRRRCELDDLAPIRGRNPLCAWAEIFRNIELNYFRHDSSPLLPQQPQLAYIFANPEDAGKSLFWDIGVGVKLEES